MYTIYKVKEKELIQYIEGWSTGLLLDNRYLLYSYNKDKHIYIGIDNTTDNCWVEEFKNEKDCLKWLKSCFN